LQIVYIGHKGDKFDTLQEHTSNFDFLAFIKGGKFRRYHGENLLAHLIDVRTLALNVRDFFRVIASVGAALRILRRVKPDVVFSKGGFIAVPVGIAARILKIPIVTHDSDTVPGLANRIIGRWAVFHTTGMPAHYYPYPKDTTAYVGIPIGEGLKPLTPSRQKELRKKLGLPVDSTILLIAGGGHGARDVNNVVTQIAPPLLESNLSLHIVHIAGQTHEAAVRSAYRNSLLKTQRDRVMVLGYSNDFHSYSAVADLIISRAGATALAEFAALAKACIVIPSPYLTGGHQLKNAEQLKKLDAAVVMDNGVAADELLAVVSELLNNDQRRWYLGQNLAKTAIADAAEKIADILIRIVNTKNN
jgi:UDP-N-acetylglucosamine--N-acetylmuramyl-(pentapeptide) pyrophosphoryl-undecaprenol N-acetylglucosamine transferase